VSSSGLFWTYWLPHYTGLVWQVLATAWILLSPVALAVALWPRYANFGRRWLALLNLLLASSGLLWIVSITTEFVRSWYPQGTFVQFAFINYDTGPYWWAAWRFVFLMITAQLFWVRRCRSSRVLAAMLLLGWLISGFIVVWQLAHNDYLPSSWPIGKWLPYFLP
jgi:hypothetical protein